MASQEETRGHDSPRVQDSSLLATSDNCPPVEKLEMFYEELLSEEEALSIEEHLFGCERCGHVVDFILQTSTPHEPRPLGEVVPSAMAIAFVGPAGAPARAVNRAIGALASEAPACRSFQEGFPLPVIARVVEDPERRLGEVDASRLADFVRTLMASFPPDSPLGVLVDTVIGIMTSRKVVSEGLSEAPASLERLIPGGVLVSERVASRLAPLGFLMEPMDEGQWCRMVPVVEDPHPLRRWGRVMGAPLRGWWSGALSSALHGIRFGLQPHAAFRSGAAQPARTGASSRSRASAESSTKTTTRIIHLRRDQGVTLDLAVPAGAHLYVLIQSGGRLRLYERFEGKAGDPNTATRLRINGPREVGARSFRPLLLATTRPIDDLEALLEAPLGDVSDAESPLERLARALSKQPGHPDFLVLEREAVEWSDE